MHRVALLLTLGLCVAAQSQVPHKDTPETKVGADQEVVAPLANGELEHLHARARALDHAAEQRLGDLSYFGVGVPQSYSEALRWYSLSAAGGIAQAQFDLGVIYDKGNGVPRDATRALHWYLMAAEQGHMRGQYGAAVLLNDGEGVPWNEAKAAEWFRRAADQGYVRAQFNLANMLSDGRGVSQDQRQALGWYRRAASGGYPEAQLNLALLYARSGGTPIANRLAYKWFSILASSDSFLAPNAAQGLQVIRQRLSEADLALAEKEMHDCISQNLVHCE